MSMFDNEMKKEKKRKSRDMTPLGERWKVSAEPASRWQFYAGTTDS